MALFESYERRINQINKTLNAVKRPVYNPSLDVKLTSIVLKYLYDGFNSDDFIQIGKEYSLGSKRVFRSKELSYLCFKMASDLGNVRGTFYYALAHFEGNGIPKNKVLANTILNDEIKKKIIDLAGKELASKINNPVHLVIYADMYSFGLGQPNDFEKAFDLYQKAADLGNLEAMCDLGYMYLVGQGVKKDEKLSSYWFKKSADLGYVHSMRDIGQNYLFACGVDKNIDEAKRYFELASQNNYSHGTTDLARCLMEEDGEDKITDLFLLALQQDYERTFRDLVELGFDIKALKEEHVLKKDNMVEINVIDETNSYKGVLYVSSRIKKIDPNCFYSHKELFKIFVEKANEQYCSINGVLYSKDRKTIVRYPIGLIDDSYDVLNGVEVIGEHAFQNARYLKKIGLPETLVSILDSSFDDCKILDFINIPNSVLNIGNWAFHGCDKLKKICLPKGLKELGKYPFGSCESLIDISIDKENTYFMTYNGDLYTKDMSTLLQYSIGKKETDFVVPKTVKTLKFRCFSDAYNLNIIDARLVEKIEEKVFYYCVHLSKIILNDNVLLEGERIFDNTSNDLIIERIK